MSPPIFLKSVEKPEKYFVPFRKQMNIVVSKCDRRPRGRTPVRMSALIHHTSAFATTRYIVGGNVVDEILARATFGGFASSTENG
ncbi:hypothetical protein CC1G_13967 [Coprinopsis cinerea okayama7|uniref:Uncharacterized protein n=1 Tax=Coprinopsis cinerea (strain Okayama-7 / 130 / ATCC MYA-4618 / FGSC 9003) TaxID=240176 RepID=D6RKI2_COPC7|nr:hypothetical protein CC1G_13967 [Coprinopsis cinerea okayama7\|eukprot:XP_002911927.1 hypothetical protein CC1G_13967 [Coprinopsis cinerea okayama7\